MHFVLPLNLMRLERQQDRPPATVTVFSRSVAPVELSTPAFSNVFAGYFGSLRVIWDVLRVMRCLNNEQCILQHIDTKEQKIVSTLR